MFASHSFVKAFLCPVKRLLSSLSLPAIWKIVFQASLKELRRKGNDWHPVARTHHSVPWVSCLVWP